MFLYLMLFSVSACLVFVASIDGKIGLLPSMARHISVTTCDACAADHVVRFTRPSPSVFVYCKRSKTGAGEGLETRLEPRASNSSLRTLYACESRLFKAVLDGATYLATGEEGFTVTHRGSVTPGKHNTTTFILVQFDR